MIRSFCSLLATASIAYAGSSADWCGAGTNKCSTSYSQLYDLACGFCRSWMLPSNVADNSLRVIGLDGGSLPGDTSNNHYMAQVSLASDFDINDGKVWSLHLLPSIVPNNRDGAFWSNHDNTTIYAFGGRAPNLNDIPTNSELPQLNIATQNWSVAVSDASIARLDAGANVNVPQQQVAYYIGGFQSQYTSTAVQDDNLHYATKMFELNTTTTTPRTIDAPFLPVQYGATTYLPYSDGVLLFFGGETPPSTIVSDANNSTVNSWDHVWIFDTSYEVWYRQNTTNSVRPRSDFCISTIYDQTSDSWQIWTFGGMDFKTNEVMNDVAVLSIPSFQWFNASAANTRMSTSCQTVGSQVFVIGGKTANTVSGGDNYNNIAYIYDLNKQAVASSYSASATTYNAPSSIRAAVAKSSTPATWGDSAVETLFMGLITESATAISTNTNTGSNKSTSSTGVIVGIAVGVVALLAIVCFVSWLLWRRRRASNRASEQSTDTFGKAELAQPDSPSQVARKEAPVEMAAPRVYHQLSAGEARWELDGKHEKSESQHVVHELA